MKNVDDFKTRLKIAKSKLEKMELSEKDKKGSFMGSAFKGTVFISNAFTGIIYLYFKILHLQVLY